MKRADIEQAVNLFKRLDHLNETHRGLKAMNLDPLSGHAPHLSFVYATPNPDYKADVNDRKTPPTPKAIGQRVDIHADPVTWGASVAAQLVVIENAIRITMEQLAELGVDP